VDAYTRTLEAVEFEARLKRLEGTNEQLSSCRSEIADRFGRVKAGASRPRATRGYGPDPAKSISAVATVRSARSADRGDGRPTRNHREPLR
jgi:hypothetical protein